MFDSRRLRLLFVVGIALTMATAPVASATTYSGVDAERSIDRPHPESGPHSGDRNVDDTRSSMIDVRKELTQNVRIRPSEDTTLVPGRTYTFSIVTAVEPREGWQGLLKQSSIDSPTLRISVSGDGDTHPTITGVAATSESYDVAANDLSTQTYTLSTDQFAAGSVHRTLVRVRVPNGANRFVIRTQTGRAGSVDRGAKTIARYAVSDEQDRWEKMAALAEARAETAASLHRTYESLVNRTSVETVVDRGMTNTFIQTSLVAKDLIALRAGKGAISQLKSAGMQFESYHDSLQSERKFDGPWIGPIIRVQNRMWESGLRQIQMNEVRRAGASGAALERLERLAREEAEAWRNHNRDRALRKLRKQRDLLSQRNYPVDVVSPSGLPSSGEPRFNLPQEAHQQLREVRTQSTWGDLLSEQTEAFFVGLKKFSTEQAESIETIALPMAEDPSPSVTLENAGAVRRQLADKGSVTARFVVSNAEGAGATSQQGYLSLTYEGLTVAEVEQVDTRSDDERPETATVTGEMRVATSDGDREDIEPALTDIYEQFEPGETNVYEVTFERSASGTDARISYRAAFAPALVTGDEPSFVRAPTGTEPGAQGWSVRTVSAASGGDAVWKQTLDSSVSASPTVVDGTAYIGTDSGKLYAFDTSTGEVEWSTNTGSEPLSSPTVVDGTVYTAGGILYALDAETGDITWTHEFEHEAYMSPTVVDGTAYVPTVEGVVALDLATRTTEWSVDPDGGVTTSTTVYDGTVYFGVDTYNGWVYAINAETGDRRWRVKTPELIGSSAPTVSAGTVYFGTWGGRLYAVDADTGDTNWYFAVRQSVSVGRTWDDIETVPTVHNGTVYFGTNEGRLYAVDAETGTSEWSRPLNEWVMGSPTIAGDTVYVGVDNRREVYIQAFDAATGEQYWRFNTSDNALGASASPVVANGTLYLAANTLSVGSREATLYAIGTDPQRSIGSRVRLGTLGHNGIFARQGPTVPTAPNEPPTASLTYAPEEPAAGDRIVFNAFGAKDGDGTIRSYEWRFDGEAASDAVWGVPSTWYTTHAFETVGDHTVSLTVTDDDGATASVRKTVTVTERERSRVAIADAVVSIASIENCGLTCRNVTYTIRNPTSETIQDLTTEVSVTAGEETLWTDESTVGDVPPGAEKAVTTRIELGMSAASAIQDNGGAVTITATLFSANESRTVRFEREFQS